MPKFTPWFSIDEDGHPARPGFYEVLYAWELEDNADGTTMYWDGAFWRRHERFPPSSYGNAHTSGERWRGLMAEMKMRPTPE